MPTKKEKQTFEERLGALEELVKAGVGSVMFFGIPDHKDECGSGAYADTLKAYESGVKLSESLKKDLTAAQERLIILRGGEPEEGPEEA